MSGQPKTSASGGSIEQELSLLALRLKGTTPARQAWNTMLTPEEQQLWFDIAKPVHESWIAENADKAPTQEMYDELQRLKEVYK